MVQSGPVLFPHSEPNKILNILKQLMRGSDPGGIGDTDAERFW